MESLYTSLLCASFAFSSEYLRIGGTGSAPRGILSGDAWLPLASLLYICGLFVYCLYPTVALPAATIAYLCACLPVLGRRMPSRRKLQLCFIGVAFALAAGKLMRTFPFHKWHGVPTLVVLAALWAVMTWCVVGTTADSFEILSWSYIALFLITNLQLNSITVIGYRWRLSADPLEGSACNLYWMAICVSAAGYRIKDGLAKLWINRYKSVI
jgi:hypothetical protein